MHDLLPGGGMTTGGPMVAWPLIESSLTMGRIGSRRALICRMLAGLFLARFLFTAQIDLARIAYIRIILHQVVMESVQMVAQDPEPRDDRFMGSLEVFLKGRLEDRLGDLRVSCNSPPFAHPGGGVILRVEGSVRLSNPLLRRIHQGDFEISAMAGFPGRRVRKPSCFRIQGGP